MDKKKAILLLNIIGLIITLIWLYHDRSWEPLASSILLIATLIPQFFYKTVTEESSQNNITMKQKGGKNSNNFQSAGNIIVNKLNKPNDTKRG